MLLSQSQYNTYLATVLVSHVPYFNRTKQTVIPLYPILNHYNAGHACQDHLMK